MEEYVETTTSLGLHGGPQQGEDSGDSHWKHEGAVAVDHWDPFRHSVLSARQENCPWTGVSPAPSCHRETAKAGSVKQSSIYLNQLMAFATVASATLTCMLVRASLLGGSGPGGL